MESAYSCFFIMLTISRTHIVMHCTCTLIYNIKTIYKLVKHTTITLNLQFIKRTDTGYTGGPGSISSLFCLFFFVFFSFVCLFVCFLFVCLFVCLFFFFFCLFVFFFFRNSCFILICWYLDGRIIRKSNTFLPFAQP